MGQHTKDILDGTCCQLCGQYFQDENGNLYSHGQQVVCKDCWQTLESAEKPYYTKADARVLSDLEEENVDLDFFLT